MRVNVHVVEAHGVAEDVDGRPVIPERCCNEHPGGAAQFPNDPLDLHGDRFAKAVKHANVAAPRLPRYSLT